MMCADTWQGKLMTIYGLFCWLYALPVSLVLSLRIYKHIKKVKGEVNKTLASEESLKEIKIVLRLILLQVHSCKNDQAGEFIVGYR